MSYSRRFPWGRPYLLTDVKDGVFVDEPAVFIGKKDSDMERPTVCAVCGEPLGSTGYCSFFFLGPNGRGIDMMIGNGCIRDRIVEKEVGTKEAYPRATLFKLVNEFPKSGRWYGTFLHHCIVKPYVRNKKCVEQWDDSVLKLPGVQYILRTIDNLRNDGWKLDAEMVLECGNVDLLAAHPDGRTVVFDWKSDRSFDNHDEYIAQVNRYMSELFNAGMQKIEGYIVWIMEERMEPVRLTDVPIESYSKEVRQYTPSLPIKCSLTIEMDGGICPHKKKIMEYSHHRPFGDEVSFYIPSFKPHRDGYEFKYFEAYSYRDGGRLQPFSMDDANEGFHVSFICSKKRHSFKLTANWEKTRPFKCSLNGYSANNGPDSFLHVQCMSILGEDGIDYAEFDVLGVNKQLHGKTINHVILINDGLPDGAKTEWTADELCKGMKIRIPCIDDNSTFHIRFETKKMPKEEKKNHTKTEPVFEPKVQSEIHNDLITSLINVNGSSWYPNESIHEIDDAEYRFTPGRIYESGGRYYGIYRRMSSERYNTSAKVDVAEVDISGKKISYLERRYVYLTPGGKEFIFAMTNRQWKIYIKDVLVGLSPEGIERC